MTIEEVGDGNQVLQRVETFLPHLIFMDIQLPGENGLHLTKSELSQYLHHNPHQSRFSTIPRSGFSGWG
jgi:CheY-like chemotaxis protein